MPLMVLAWPCKSLAQMGLLYVTNRAQRPKWVFCTPYTVRRISTNCIGFLGLIIVSCRAGCIGRTFGFNPVFSAPPMVVPFPGLVRNRCFQYNLAYYRISFQDSGWYAQFAITNCLTIFWVHHLLITEAFAEIGQEQANGDQSASNQDNKFKQLFRLREVHLLAFFILIYVGVEVTLGGEHISPVLSAVCKPNGSHRLDCDVYHSREGRWTIIWLHFLRLFRR